ncbi:MAG: DUF4234 domain-containing protein [Candidatus Dormibacteria bacterium]
MGRHRSLTAVILLSLVTLGLYTIIWHARVNREMSDFHFGLDVHPRRTATAIAIAWLLAFAVTAAGAARVAVHLAHVSLSFDPQITWQQALFLIPAVLAAPILYVLLPFSLVAVVMTIERVRLVEAHSGLPTDQQVRPASLVWGMLIPLVGAPLVLAREQRHLNATWERAAASATAPGWGYDYGR